MAKRIGELLVEKELITREQLFAGLKAQLMLGGHLGTSLIELGFITEERLGRELSEIMGIPYAPREMFDDIPEWAISCLDASLVEKHRALPIGKQANSLHLAVINPRDIAPLSGISGYKIVPWVSPETRIVEAMEQYYNIPRSTRYICISKELTRNRSDHAKQAEVRQEVYPGDWMTLAAQPAVSENGKSREAGEDFETHAIDLCPDIGGPALDTAGGAIGGSWRDIAKRYFEEDQAGRSQVTPRQQSRPASEGTSDASRWTFAEVAMLMSHSDDRTELFRLVMTYLSSQLSAAILFRVSQDVATAQASHGDGLDGALLEDLEFDVTENSLFDLLLGEEAYCGPVPKGACYQRFYEALRRDVPSEIALVPVYLTDRLVAILYGEGKGDAPLAESLPDLRQLARKLSLTLHMLVLKMKIRAM